MQPKSNLPYSHNALGRLEEKLIFTKTTLEKRLADPAYASFLPNEIGLKLTNRCDLRCKHCFQWNDIGYHRNLSKVAKSPNGDLDIKLIADLLTSTESLKSHLYLWGGEPMVYSHWDELINLLEADPRETVICTNGLSIASKIDSLIRISETLTVLVSVEGLEKEHDSLRGQGSFRRIIDQIQLLAQLRKSGSYTGNISVAAVISNKLIPNLYDCCRYYEQLKGIDTLYFNFPWFIPRNEASYMDNYYREHFDWMQNDRGPLNSWHSFDWHLDLFLLPILQEQLSIILSNKWRIRIRFQPDMAPNELEAFLNGDTSPPKCKSMCLGISNRMDVMPDGTVTPCKKFNEFAVGNLHDHSLSELWQGEDFKRFRTIHNNTLMPICAKCEILYSNGI